MYKYTKNAEKAYALPMILALLLLVSTVGTALIALAVTSATVGAKGDRLLKAQSRAEDAMVYWETRFAQALENLGNIPSSQAPVRTQEAAQMSLPPAGEPFSAEVKSLETVVQNDVFYTGKLTMVFSGWDGESVRKVKRTYAVTNMPFMYALASGGDIVFNGAAYVEGDVIAKGPLKVSKYARWHGCHWQGPEHIISYLGCLIRNYILGGSNAIETGYSALTKPNGGASRVILTQNKNVYIDNSWRPYNDATLETAFYSGGNIRPPQTANVQHDVFNIDVEGIVSDKVAEAEQLRNDLIQRSKKPPDDIFKQVHVINGDLTVNGVYWPGPGDLYVKGDVKIKGGMGWLFVTGNLVIDGNLTMECGPVAGIEFCPMLTAENNVYVRGNAILRGDVSLGNKDNWMVIKKNPNWWERLIDTIDIFGFLDKTPLLDRLNFSNGALYVNDSIYIRDTFRTPVSPRDAVVFAKGNAFLEGFQNRVDQNARRVFLLVGQDLYIYNNNEYEDAPQKIKAYLYSNGKAVLYGVASNIELHGGLYAKESLVLNATKGKTTDNPTSETNFVTGGLYVEKKQLAISPERSRLRIIFDPDLILRPPDALGQAFAPGIFSPGTLSFTVLETRLEQ